MYPFYCFNNININIVETNLFYDEIYLTIFLVNSYYNLIVL